jgi:hypothetical protein
MNDTYFISYMYYDTKDRLVVGNGLYEVVKDTNFIHVIPQVEEQLSELKSSEVIITNFIKSNDKSRILKGR